MRSFLFCLTLLTPLQSFACKCPPGASLEENFTTYEEVFLGQATTAVPKSKDRNGGIVDFEVSIAVIKVFKGNPPAEVFGSAKGMFDGSEWPKAKTTCGTGLIPARVFVVFRNTGEVPGFSGCSDTIWYAGSELLKEIESMSKGASE